MKFVIRFLTFSALVMLFSTCNDVTRKPAVSGDDFDYFIDQFEDIRVLRYRLPGFESLSLKQKEYIYYLSQAALVGRDILWDQNFKYNLRIRKTLEAVIGSFAGDTESEYFKAFMTYAKRVFFANGIHHHYSSDKFKPGFGEDYFSELVRGCNTDDLPLAEGETVDELLSVLTTVIFDENLYARKVEQRAGSDMVAESATNFYEGVTQEEVEEFYSNKIIPGDPRPVSIGLNSRVVKVDGKVTEETYRSGGKYGEVIDNITGWLEKAAEVAETELQQKELKLLIEYYKTGDLKTWDDYNVIWAGNTESQIDYINGFIETYEDPLGMKATWEAVVEYIDMEASGRTRKITENAQWFEDNSPVQQEYKKEKVTGVAAKVINVAMLGGDCHPASPLGINLPNADWIRKEIGSKSVTLANISTAYDIASQGNGFLQEFAADEEEIERARKYGTISGDLHTDLHECVGHASGKLAEGTDPNSLRNYASPLEETRADLFALYYVMDEKMVELDLLPNAEASRAAYDAYLRNGLLTQIVRIEPGKDIEQAHMRCRSSISHWVYEKGKDENVVEFIKRDGKTYVKINDYGRLRELFGELLKEIQRIKSEGDYEAGKDIIENYGIKIDAQLHSEILDRYEKLKLAPYTGFINPVLIPVYDADSTVTDIKVEYRDDFVEQMMRYGRDYTFLTSYE